MIPVNNQLLLKLVPARVKGKLMSREELIEMAEKHLPGTPVVLKMGAINYRIGAIHFIRVGRTEIYGDIRLELEGALELGPVRDDDGKVIGAKPERFVFKRE